jgi:hypothetical protein
MGDYSIGPSFLLLLLVGSLFAAGASGLMQTEDTLRPGGADADGAPSRAKAGVPTVGVAPLAGFVIKMILLIGFVSSAWPFGALAVQSVNVRAGDGRSVDLRLAEIHAWENGLVHGFWLAVFFVAYVILCLPQFREWADRRPGE